MKCGNCSFNTFFSVEISSPCFDLIWCNTKSRTRQSSMSATKLLSFVGAGCAFDFEINLASSRCGGLMNGVSKMLSESERYCHRFWFFFAVALTNIDVRSSISNLDHVQFSVLLWARAGDASFVNLAKYISWCRMIPIVSVRVISRGSYLPYCAKSICASKHRKSCKYWMITWDCVQLCNVQYTYVRTVYCTLASCIIALFKDALRIFSYLRVGLARKRLGLHKWVTTR